MVGASVIMPTYNKASYLDLTLAGFLIQECKDFEIIIVDDGSTDETYDTVKKYQDQINLTYHYQENSGRSTARNTALKYSQSNRIIFNDDDRIPAPDFISKHMELLKGEAAVNIGNKQLILTLFNEVVFKMIPRQDIVEFIRRDPDKFEQMLKSDHQLLFTAGELIHDFAGAVRQYTIKNSDHEKLLRTRYATDLNEFRFGWIFATTGNLSFNLKKELNIQFDTNYKGWGMEDTDFAYQLALHGYQFRFAQQAINYHQLHPRTDGEADQMLANVKHFHSKYHTNESFLFAQTYIDIATNNATFIDVFDDVLDALKSFFDLPLEELQQKYFNLVGRRVLP